MTFPFPIAHFAGGKTIIEVTINSSQNDTNAFTAADAVGDPSANVGNGEVHVFLGSGVTLGASATSTYGLRAGTGWGNGWKKVRVFVLAGTARIQGKGGNGGNGILQISAGSGQGGGGGGGAGTAVGTGGTAGAGATAGSPGSATAGGGGGAGALAGGFINLSAGNGQTGGGAILAESGANVPDIDLEPAIGATLQYWAGAGGGGGGGANTGAGVGSGGNGGGPGLAGAAGTGGNGNGGATGPGTGGAPGPKITTPGTATINEVGPGTIDARGA